ncbi:MAG TPA: hypothetical protein VGK99_00310 [Acidobacteriota bacterium]|jgi:hypothetical protein
MSFQKTRAIRARTKGELGIPVYPADALKSKISESTVAVRILISTDGKVTEISDSPLMASSTGPFAGEFRAATEEAIKTWLFEPAEIQTLEDGKDLDGDGKPDYRIVVATQKIPIYRDLHFDFKVVVSEGKVRATVTTSSFQGQQAGSKEKEKERNKDPKKSKTKPY